MDSAKFKLPIASEGLIVSIIPSITLLIGLSILVLMRPEFAWVGPSINAYMAALGRYSWLQYLIGPISLGVSLYIVGHIISTFSSLFIDKIFISSCHGYPYEKLLKTKVSYSNTRKFRIRCYYAIFGLVLSWPMVVVVSNGSLALNVFWGVFVSLLVLLKIAIARAIRIYKHGNSLLNDIFEKKDTIEKAWSLASSPLVVLSVPFSVILKTWFNLLKLKKPLSSELIRSFSKKYEETFGMDMDCSDTEIFWMPYLYVSKINPFFSETLRKHLMMYTFARNLSTIFLVLTFVGCMLISVFHISDYRVSAYIYINYSLFILFLTRYFYLYNSYFSKIVFRSFVIETTESDRDKEKQKPKPNSYPEAAEVELSSPL